MHDLSLSLSLTHTHTHNLSLSLSLSLYIYIYIYIYWIYLYITKYTSLSIYRYILQQRSYEWRLIFDKWVRERERVKQ